MAIQLSTAVRNAQLDQIESISGVSSFLSFRTGAQPANCAAADAGTLLIQMSLPTDWLNAASGGSKTKLGTWSGTTTAAGTVAHFRLKDTSNSTTHMQGSVTAVGGGGDIEVDSVGFVDAQLVTVNTFAINAANA